MASVPSAIARCVLPTPGGPSSSTLSLRSSIYPTFHFAALPPRLQLIWTAVIYAKDYLDN